jgi:hypothetical protein
LSTVQWRPARFTFSDSNIDLVGLDSNHSYHPFTNLVIRIQVGTGDQSWTARLRLDQLSHRCANYIFNAKSPTTIEGTVLFPR